MRDGSRGFPQTSTYSVVLGNAHQGARNVSLTGLSPPMVPLSSGFSYASGFLLPDLHANWSASAPQHPRYKGRVLECIRWFRLFPVRSSLLGKSLLLFLPGGTEIFQFPPFALRTYEFSTEFRPMTGGGLPHSEIAGSQVVSTYPTLIAGYHVLHRLLVPRHPSYALSNLTKNRS